jgi:hypothetical protein
MKTRTLALALLLSAGPSPAQTTAPKTWNGSASCDVTVTGPGYNDQQTHKWAMTGAAPTKSGAFDIYPGTWSVSGGGSLDRTQGSQTLHAEWKRSVAGMSAPISVIVRASDGAILIGAGHAQLRAANAVSGTQEVRVDGKVTGHSQIGLEAFEYAFPSTQSAAKSTQVSGQKSDSPSGSFGPMQPAGSKVQVSCNWSFQQGGGAAVPQSTSAASTAASAPAGGGITTVTPAGTTTPTPAPTSASSNQTIQPPGAGGNYRAPPAATQPGGNSIPEDSAPGSTAPTGCDKVQADVLERYLTTENALENEYAQLRAEKVAEIDQLKAQLSALNSDTTVRTSLVRQAQAQALQRQIRQLEKELAQADAEHRTQLAKEQDEGNRAALLARAKCEAAKASP